MAALAVFCLRRALFCSAPTIGVCVCVLGVCWVCVLGVCVLGVCVVCGVCGSDD